LAVAAALAAAWTAVAWIRHLNFWTGGFDLGVFDQAAWLLSRGHGPHVSLVDRSLFADHLSPVIVLFAPLYRLVATPFWLLGAQGVAVAATVLPVRALARHFGVSPWLGTVLLATNAPLMAAAIFDFHPSTLATPFVAWAVLAAVRGDRRAALVAALAVLVCRADLGWVLVGVAIVAQPSVRLRLLVIGAAGAVAGAVVPDLLGNPGTWEPYYGHLGAGPADALLHPWRVADALATRDVLFVVVTWLLPVGFVVLRRPRWLTAILVAGAPILVSQWAGTKLPWFHYGAPLTPLVVGGALAAMAASAHDERARMRVAALVGAGLGVLLWSPLSPRAPHSVQVWATLRPEPGVDLAAAVREVAPGEPVAGSNRAVAHLTHRREVHMWPLPFWAPTDTYPGGLAPDPSAHEAAAIDIVVLDPKDAADAAARGFAPVPDRHDGVWVGRR
jgi:uncharacterized membrane protein